MKASISSQFKYLVGFFNVIFKHVCNDSLVLPPLFSCSREAHMVRYLKITLWEELLETYELAQSPSWVLGHGKHRIAASTSPGPGVQCSVGATLCLWPIHQLDSCFFSTADFFLVTSVIFDTRWSLHHSFQIASQIGYCSAADRLVASPITLPVTFPARSLSAPSLKNEENLLRAFNTHGLYFWHI